MVTAAAVIDFFSQLEGPYRWYTIGFVLMILTALVTRFIFKTLKWFLVLAVVAAFIFMAVEYLPGYLRGL